MSSRTLKSRIYSALARNVATGILLLSAVPVVWAQDIDRDQALEEATQFFESLSIPDRHSRCLALLGVLGEYFSETEDPSAQAQFNSLAEPHAAFILTAALAEDPSATLPELIQMLTERGAVHVQYYRQVRESSLETGGIFINEAPVASGLIYCAGMLREMAENR